MPNHTKRSKGNTTPGNAGTSETLRLLGRFCRDERGGYVIMTALLMPVLIGAAAIGTESGLLFRKHRILQNAADFAAASSAAAFMNGANITEITLQAHAVAASFGYVHGANDVEVTVNMPPVSGKYTGSLEAVEVIVTQPQEALFSAIWSKVPVAVSARAVALGSGAGCVLALNKTAASAGHAAGGGTVKLNGCSLYDNSANATALSVDGSSQIEALSVGVVGGISGSGNIMTTNGVATGISPIKDPYADVAEPSFSGCDYNHFTAQKTMTIEPGVYCKGFTVNAGAVVTFKPGVYIFDRGSFKVNGGGTIQGEGVTLFFTSSTEKNWAEMSINGGATVDLTGPTAGPFAGMVLFGDRDMPIDTTFSFNGGANQYFGGAVYLPSGRIEYSGGSKTKSGCTQLIGDTIKFSGDSNLAIDCKGNGVKPVTLSSLLVE